jgi:hypothetical protein
LTQADAAYFFWSYLSKNGLDNMQIENDTLLKDEDAIQKLQDAGFKNLEQSRILISINEVGKFCAVIDYGEDDITLFWNF